MSPGESILPAKERGPKPVLAPGPPLPRTRPLGPRYSTLGAPHHLTVAADRAEKVILVKAARERCPVGRNEGRNDTGRDVPAAGAVLLVSDQGPVGAFLLPNDESTPNS